MSTEMSQKLLADRKAQLDRIADLRRWVYEIIDRATGAECALGTENACSETERLYYEEEAETNSALLKEQFNQQLAAILPQGPRPLTENKPEESK